MQARNAHSVAKHKNNVSIKYATFNDMDSFMTWKMEQEVNTQTSFVQHRGAKVRKCEECTVTHYYCNRQGDYHPKGKGKRGMKSQGTCKLGETCTAYMKVIKCLKDGKIAVEYCTDHSHEIAIAHLRIPQDTRVSIAKKLQDGVNIDRVLDQVRDDVCGTLTLGRQHLVNKQDIRNIEKQFNVDGIQKHTADSQSVHAWVQELQSCEYKPVLLYKVQGVVQLSIGNSEAFDEDDFALCIQTQFQCDMLKRFGKNCICIDSTHSTNHYDFPLTTLMVIDEFGEGVPVAYMISNRETAAVIEAFYESIKSRVGSVEPQVFMSDDAPHYFNTWKKVFGDSCNTKKLLCRWHIDKSWRRAIKDKVHNKELQPEVYRFLMVLLQESTLIEFNKKLQQLLTFLNDKGMDEFLQYFQTNYCSRIEQWATHARCYTPVNTNMHLESFHRLVKVVYFQQKQNRRVDALLSVLIKLSRDKAFERLQKIEKGKNSYRMNEINKRHKNAEQLNNRCIKAVSHNCWMVESQEREEFYTVGGSQSSSGPCSCKLKCANCGVCPHMYTCTCLDSVLHNTACKHIHFVHMTTVQTLMTANENLHSNEANTIDSDKEYSVSFQEYVTVDRQSVDGNSTTATETLLSTCKELQLLIPKVSDTNAIKNATKSMRSIISLLKGTLEGNRGTRLIPTSTYAANTNNQKQMRFHSTKKKREKQSNRWSKPTREEELSICNKLSGVEVKFCGVCFKEDDGYTDCPYVNWVQCTKCSIWLHEKCSNTIADLPFCASCPLPEELYPPSPSAQQTRPDLTPPPAVLYPPSVTTPPSLDAPQSDVAPSPSVTTPPSLDAPQIESGVAPSPSVTTPPSLDTPQSDVAPSPSVTTPPSLDAPQSGVAPSPSVTTPPSLDAPQSGVAPSPSVTTPPSLDAPQSGVAPSPSVTTPSPPAVNLIKKKGKRVKKSLSDDLSQLYIPISKKRKTLPPNRLS